jgi:hypothetical protein
MRCNRGWRKSIESAFSDSYLAVGAMRQARIWGFGPREPSVIPLIRTGGQSPVNLSDRRARHKLPPSPERRTLVAPRCGAGRRFQRLPDSAGDHGRARLPQRTTPAVASNPPTTGRIGVRRGSVGRGPSWRESGPRALRKALSRPLLRARRTVSRRISSLRSPRSARPQGGGACGGRLGIDSTAGGAAPRAPIQARQSRDPKRQSDRVDLRT